GFGGRGVRRLREQGRTREEARGARGARRGVRTAPARAGPPRQRRSVDAGEALVTRLCHHEPMTVADSTSSATPTPRLRAALDTFPPYVPGKPPRQVEGLRPYKLSSNENFLPPLPEVLETMAEQAKDPAHYPDDAAQALRQDRAERLDVDPDELVVTTGASELLVALPEITSDQNTEAIYPWPSFEMYPQTTGLVGAERIEVALTADGRHDLEA